MKRYSSISPDWYDEDEPAPALGTETFFVMSGLPRHWKSYGWWLGALAFALIWTVESLTASWPLTDAQSMGYFTRSICAMVFALAMCWALYAFCKPHSVRLARVFVIAQAVAVLVDHIVF